MERINIRLIMTGPSYGAELVDTQTGRRVGSFSGWESKKGAENTALKLAARIEARLEGKEN